VLNNASLDLTDADAKYATFFQVPGSQLKFCMNNSGWKCANQNYSGYLKDFVQLQTTSQI
jgi:hypothetical protein